MSAISQQEWELVYNDDFLPLPNSDFWNEAPTLCRLKYSNEKFFYWERQFEKRPLLGMSATASAKMMTRADMADLDGKPLDCDEELKEIDRRARQAEAQRKYLNELYEQITDDEEPDLPEFPRMMGSLSDLADVLYPDIPYSFKLMAAITHFGLIRSGLDTLANEPHLQPRFYTCFIAEPSRGKTAAINEVRNIMAAVSSRPSVISSVDSGPALVDEFSDRASKMLLVGDTTSRVLLDPDEMKDLFEKSKQSTQTKNTLSNEFLKLFETNRTGNRSRKTGKSQVDNAHLAILGGATPEGYQNMWAASGGGASGLQSRFVLVATSHGPMPTNPRGTSTAALDSILERLRRQANQDGQTVRMTPEAVRLLQEWWSSTPRDSLNHTRVSDMVKRVLLVLAVTNDKTEIDSELMQIGVQFGDYLIAIRDKYNPNDSYSWCQAFENDILKTANKHQKPMTFREFQRLIHPERSQED